MKKYPAKCIAILLLIIGSSFAASAQVVIKVRPVAPIVRIRPPHPGGRHVWVTGEYMWRGNQYIYTDGYWAVPPPRYSRWVEGRWKHRRGGWFWIPGHWK